MKCKVLSAISNQQSAISNQQSAKLRERQRREARSLQSWLSPWRVISSQYFFLLILCIPFFSLKTFADPIFRINHGTNQQIDKFSVCKTITNNDPSKDIMVPTNTSGEWTAFLAHLPSNVTANDCLPYTPALSGYGCSTPTNTVTLTQNIVLYIGYTGMNASVFVNGVSIGNPPLTHSFVTGDTFYISPPGCSLATITIHETNSSGPIIQTLSGCGGICPI